MHHLSCKIWERPFPCEPQDAEQEIYYLQDGRWLDGAIEVLGEKVPEDFGPEEAFYGSGNLV